MTIESPSSIRIEDLINPKDPKLAPNEKISKRAAWHILWRVKGELEDRGVKEPTIQDFLHYQIVVRSNDSVHLAHNTIPECSLYHGIGFTTLRTIQDALQARVGQKLEIHDRRSDKCLWRPLGL